MLRSMAATAAAIVVSGALVAAPVAEAAAAFEQVPLPPPTPTSHVAAYACLATGVGVMATSFVLARHADHAYDRYLEAEVPSEIDRLYDESVRYDRLSSGALIGGEVLLAAGLYLRFLRRATSHVELALHPGRCAVSCRF